MLSSPVYTESHPRRNAVHTNSSISFKSFNSRIFNSFRTLLHNRRLQPLYFQSLPDSFHCHGGVYPLVCPPWLGGVRKIMGGGGYEPTEQDAAGQVSGKSEAVELVAPFFDDLVAIDPHVAIARQHVNMSLGFPVAVGL